MIGKRGPTVGDVMTPDVVSVPSGAAIEQVAALMTERRIKRVPVIDEGVLIGIVSRADIVRALAGRL